MYVTTSPSFFPAINSLYLQLALLMAGYGGMHWFSDRTNRLDSSIDTDCFVDLVVRSCFLLSSNFLIFFREINNQSLLHVIKLQYLWLTITKRKFLQTEMLKLVLLMGMPMFGRNFNSFWSSMSWARIQCMCEAWLL